MDIRTKLLNDLPLASAVIENVGSGWDAVCQAVLRAPDERAIERFGGEIVSFNRLALWSGSVFSILRIGTDCAMGAQRRNHCAICPED